MTDDEADFALLSMANYKKRFAIAINIDLEKELLLSLDRGIDNNWFQLIDVTFVPEAKAHGPMRIFRLTDSGLARLAEVAKGRQQS